MISYSIIGNDNVKTDHINEACYYKHYNHLNKYKTVLIYCDKKWLAKKDKDSGFGKYSWDAFTKEEYEEYTHLLNVMGLKFKMHEEESRFVFTVDIKKNGIVATKIILNSVRYLCESPYPIIVKEFLRLSRQKMVGVNNYSKFMLAHQVQNIGHGGHTFISSMSLPELLSNDDLKKKFLSSTSNDSVCRIIPESKNGFHKKTDKMDKYNCYKYVDLRQNLFEMFAKQAPLKDIVKEYKAVYNECNV